VSFGKQSRPLQQVLVFLLTLVVAAMLSRPCLAAAESPEVIRLWSEAAPGALGDADQDIPTLSVYFPDAPSTNRAAMVIFPGGGYGHLATHEGEGYARFLNSHGITAFVVKYRLGSDGYRHPAMLQDAARAVRLVRSRADVWNLDTRHIGVMGSSAGGHLASTVLTHFDAGDPEAPDPVDRVSSRPDLGILCYPVITMGPQGHAGSRRKLLGAEPSPELVALLSNEKQVTADTPPCFIWHTVEDTAVPVENSLAFAVSLRQSGVPFELHLYEQGSHGLGLGNRDGGSILPWASECVRWLELRGFVP
jgi:acetyl esterase/lipase